VLTIATKDSSWYSTMRCLLVPDQRNNDGWEGAWNSAEGDIQCCYTFMLDSLCEHLVQIVPLEWFLEFLPITQILFLLSALPEFKQYLIWLPLVLDVAGGATNKIDAKLVATFFAPTIVLREQHPKNHKIIREGVGRHLTISHSRSCLQHHSKRRKLSFLSFFRFVGI
jgi:hypothetical protein